MSSSKDHICRSSTLGHEVLEYKAGPRLGTIVQLEGKDDIAGVTDIANWVDALGSIHRSLVVAMVMLVLITLTTATSADDGSNAYSYNTVDTGDIPMGEAMVLELPLVPLAEDYHIIIEVTTELSGTVDVHLLDDANGLLREGNDVEMEELHWVVSPDENASFIVITPSVAPAGKNSVNLEWRLRVLEDVLVTDHSEGPVEEESRPYWTNPTVLVLGIAGAVVTVVLLILALQPFRLEPSARNDLAIARHHQQKMR